MTGAVRAFLHALASAANYRTDRVGTVALIETGGAFAATP